MTCECSQTSKVDPVEYDCICCFYSDVLDELAENELDVTEKRDVETIGLVETEASNMRKLNTVQYETGYIK